MSGSVRAVVMLLVCVFAWGSVFPLAKLVLVDMNEMSLAFWRFMIAGVSLAAYLLVLRQPWPRLNLRQYAIVAVVAVIGVGGLNVALFSGLRLTEPTNGALIMALSPVVTSLMAAIAARRLPSPAQGFSLVVGLLGVMIVISGGSLQRLLALSFNQGDLIIMLGMLAWSFYTLCSQFIGRWLPALPFTALSMLAGAVTLGLVCLFSTTAHPWQELLQLPSVSVLTLFYIGLFATVGGYLLWISGINALGSATASLFFNFVPVFAALTSVLMGHNVSALQLVGMLVVVVGLTLPALLTKGRRSLAAAGGSRATC
ncbi:MAG: DMT family transporter [Pseudomonas sp.]|uniref:DMT family transporter n=1 Tax=Pseudomonas sp. TaxID=306 RepID=UPI003982BEC9